jgi:hypothetical protein
LNDFIIRNNHIKQNSLNPSSKGWLKEYYSHFKSRDFELDFSKDMDKYIYDLLSESSILFSIPLERSCKIHPNFNQWNFKEKVKIVFADMLFMISEIYVRKNKFVTTSEEVYKRFSTSNNSDLDTEKYIDELLDGKKNSLFLNAYNSNPWLFFYLIEFYFSLEKQTIGDSNDLKIKMIKGMILSAKSNESVSKKEDRLLKRYIENANIEKSDKENLYKLIDINTKFSHPDFSKDHQLFKQVAYDLALLALMTDSKIDAEELNFINLYAEKLNISLREQHKTFALVQDIHLNHYKLLPYFNKIYTINSVRNIVAHNFKYVLKKNSGMIINEVKESRELLSLLRKSVSEKLSEEEKAKVREQILDLIKTIPSLSIFMIPGGTILLPILMKILPQDLLYPSSFVNKIEK